MRSRRWDMVLAAWLAGAAGASAQLVAQSSDGYQGTANLVQSRLRATVGAQWIDVEEEAEIGAVESVNGWYPNGDPSVWLVAGSVALPPQAVVTSCLLWNGDTLLMGKLRGQADAEHIYDSLVPARPVQWARDPLLVQQVGSNTYSIQLYPVASGGTRRFRLRYLLPVLNASGEVSIKPVLSQVNGSRPSLWTFELRGNQTVKLSMNGNLWPVTAPAQRVYDFPSGDVTLRWNSSSDPDGSRAVRNHTDSGSWAGDYVLYTGKLPDSIAKRLDIRSETMFLWHWIQPQTFIRRLCDGCSGYLNDDGSTLVSQAQQISNYSSQLTSFGNKVGLVADEGLGDSVRTFPLGDSASASYVNLKSWLAGIGYDYLNARIPSGGIGNPSAMDAGKSRERFRADIVKAGTFFSKDSGIVREILVVTVGPVPAGQDRLEIPAIALPEDVSVRSSDVVPTSRYTCTEYNCRLVDVPAGSGAWPGVDLVGFAKAHPGTGKLRKLDGTELPAVRTAAAATISIVSEKGLVARDVQLQRGPSGEWLTSFNVHGKSLERSLKWDIWDDSANSIASWATTPEWKTVTNDSVVPRLWARSQGHVSTVFPSAVSLAPYFGFVDQQYSLLATPSDTLGKSMQQVYADSGVPFLRGQDIFAAVGYGKEGGASGITGSRSVAANGALRASLLSGTRKVVIRFDGLELSQLVIRDLRGRVVAQWSASELSHRSSVQWNGQDLSRQSVARGIYLVSARSAVGSHTVTVALP